MAPKYILHSLCCALLLVALSAFAQDLSRSVREEHTVVVDGVEEQWRLEWAGPTHPTCAPGEPEWMTCPCSGFAFGESGNLWLVRKRPGQEDELLLLNRFFTGQFDSPADEGVAVLRRWDLDKTDIDDADEPEFATRVKARPVATVMSFADYDHDGRPTEFLLQVGTLPCGKRMSIAIGISRRNGRVHAFTTVENPEQPLVLQASQWEALLQAKTPQKVLDWKCGDHGSETETELELSADAQGIHATRIEYACDEQGNRGQILKREALRSDESSNE
jgi:hypothetical protein